METIHLAALAQGDHAAAADAAAGKAVLERRKVVEMPTSRDHALTGKERLKTTFCYPSCYPGERFGGGVNW